MARWRLYGQVDLKWPVGGSTAKWRLYGQVAALRPSGGSTAKWRLYALEVSSS